MASFYYNRFATFRKVLDAEMKDATKCGIAQKCQMDSREEITEDEEGILWEKGLLGGHSAESLMYIMYFYKGKLFGLRACEHKKKNKNKNLNVAYYYLLHKTSD